MYAIILKNNFKAYHVVSKRPPGQYGDWPVREFVNMLVSSINGFKSTHQTFLGFMFPFLDRNLQ